MKNEWFEVDKEGLSKLLSRRGGKTFLLYELIQNAWDEITSVVNVTLQQHGPRLYELTVEDNNPEGFKNLRHAFTLFAESEKKSNPVKRGKLNLGEKLVLACCNSAEIISTTGSILFSENGKRTKKDKKTKSGSVFKGIIRMTVSEYEEVCREINKLIPPLNVDTYFNGNLIEQRAPICEFEAPLLTETPDGDGNLFRTVRNTRVRVFNIKEGETPSIYEMGIPVVETNDKYHVDVQQKVPVNFERDNVPPSYLRTLRVYTLNNTFNLLQEKDTTDTWVKDALEDKRVGSYAVKKVIEERFGDNAVAFDPTDIEGTKISASEGRTVVPGATFSKQAWENIRNSKALPPAGQITPSPKPYSENGKPLNLIPSEQWTEQMNKVAEYAKNFALNVLGRSNLPVLIAKEISWPFSATYGKDSPLVLNMSRLGKAFFDEFPQNIERVDRLFIHEFGHHYSIDHLSSEYHEALCRIGAKLKQCTLDNVACSSVSKGALLCQI